MKRFKKFGTALLSCMMLTASFATVSNMTMITAEAHPGRTDAQGGHHDYQNKSGLGSYHYHCGGHPAHLHDNGVCPYSSNYTSTTSHKSTKKVSKYYKASTVRKVQKKLNKLGYKCGKVDGSYGKKTKIAIRKYQRKKGMTVNGKINKSLCKKLHIRV